MNDLYPWQYMYAQEHARCEKLEAELKTAVDVIRDICDHCGWNVHSPTCREIDCPIEPWLPTAPPHNYIGEEAVAGPEEVQDESN